MNRKLYRSNSDPYVTGLLGGISEYFNISSNMVRLIFIIVLLFSPKISILFYVVASAFIPVNPHDYDPNYYDQFHSDYSDSSSDISEKKVLGIALLAFGVLALLKKLFSGFDTAILFPILLIFLGIYIVFKEDSSKD